MYKRDGLSIQKSYNGLDFVMVDTSGWDLGQPSKGGKGEEVLEL